MECNKLSFRTKHIKYLSWTSFLVCNNPFQNIVMKLGLEIPLGKTIYPNWKLHHYPPLLRSHQLEISLFWTLPIYLRLQSKHVFIGLRSNSRGSIMTGHRKCKCMQYHLSLYLLWILGPFENLVNTIFQCNYRKVLYQWLLLETNT